MMELRFELRTFGSNIYFLFQLNFSRVGSHLLKGSLSPQVRGSVKVLIK
jgi:hypothetical protein